VSDLDMLKAVQTGYLNMLDPVMEQYLEINLALLILKALLMVHMKEI